MKINYYFKPNNEYKKGSIENAGIYVIILGNGIYIGKTSISFKSRFISHYTSLLNNTHYNDRCLDSFKENKRCIFIPLIYFKSKDELNNDIFITNLESYIISHFPINRLLNNECKAPKSNIINLLKTEYPDVLNQANEYILFIEELIKYSNCSLEDLIRYTKIAFYKYFHIKRKVKQSIK